MSKNNDPIVTEEADVPVPADTESSTILPMMVDSMQKRGILPWDTWDMFEIGDEVDIVGPSQFGSRERIGDRTIIIGKDASGFEVRPCSSKTGIYFSLSSLQHVRAALAPDFFGDDFFNDASKFVLESARTPSSYTGPGAKSPCPVCGILNVSWDIQRRSWVCHNLECNWSFDPDKFNPREWALEKTLKNLVEYTKDNQGCKCGTGEYTDLTMCPLCEAEFLLEKLE